MTLKQVDRYTRAGKMGRMIICPHCDSPSVVYRFSWGSLQCDKCKELSKKTDWLITVGKAIKPKQCNLCGRLTIYPTKVDHPHYKEPGKCYWCGFSQEDWIFVEDVTSDVVLRCPGSVTFWEKCTNTFVVTKHQLLDRYSYNCYGDTPYHYPGINFICPTCNQHVSGKSIILHNIEVFKKNLGQATRGIVNHQ